MELLVKDIHGVVVGVYGNYLKESVIRAGLDPDNLDKNNKQLMSFSDTSSKAKAWKDIWGAGQGVGAIDEVLPVAEIVDNLEKEYLQAVERVASYRK